MKYWLQILSVDICTTITNIMENSDAANMTSLKNNNVKLLKTKRKENY